MTSILQGQRTLLEMLVADRKRAWTPGELRDWLRSDLATQGSWRVRYNLAAYRAKSLCAEDRDRALRDLRIAATTAPISTMARLDPSFRRLRVDPGFWRTLAWTDTPRLTDLLPLRPIGAQLRAGGIFTAVQLVAQARVEADRSILAPLLKITTNDLEAATRFADLLIVLQGDSDTLYHLWTVNIRSVCDLAHADIGSLATAISIDQFDWASALCSLLEQYQRRAKEQGPTIEPHLATCPRPAPAGEASADVVAEEHCCSCTSHRCRGEHDDHAVTEPHRPGTCWICSFPKPTQSPPMPAPGKAKVVGCDHPRTIDGALPKPDEKAAVTGSPHDVAPAHPDCCHAVASCKRCGGGRRRHHRRRCWHRAYASAPEGATDKRE
jgi:hypothetical protein